MMADQGTIHGKSRNHAKVVSFFLFRHIHIYAGLLLLGLLVGFLEGLNLAIFIPMLGQLVGAIPGAATAPDSSFLLDSIEQLIRLVPISDPFLAASSLFLVLTLVKGGVALVHEYVTAWAASDVLHRYRSELMDYYRSASLSLFEETRSGSLIYNLSMPPIMLAKLLYALPRFFVDCLRFIFVLALLFYVEPNITMGLLITGFVVYLFFAKGLSGYSYNLAADRRHSEQTMTGLANEWIRGLRPIRAADADAYWIDGYKENSSRAAHVYRSASVLLASPRHILEMIAFTLLIGGMILAYQMEPATFNSRLASVGLFAMGMVRVLPSIASMARAPLEIRGTLPDVEYLYQVLKKTGEPAKQGLLKFSGLRTGIRIENARVSYPERGTILDGINVFIPKGKSAAIVGTSGAGKSTFLNVLLGAQPPSSGAVYYDEVDLRDIEAASLLRRIGYVGQDILLFRGTVRENISFFRKDLPLDRIKAAAALAEIRDFIEALPDGYDTMIGEDGENFSGGQAQRIAIARALVNDPEILILDEVTSALDSSSEKTVVQAIRHIAVGRTVVMVTHKLSSARWVDMVYVMDKGAVVEQGTWDTLLSVPGGIFHGLCRDQHLIQ